MMELEQTEGVLGWYQREFDIYGDDIAAVRKTLKEVQSQLADAQTNLKEANRYKDSILEIVVIDDGMRSKRIKVKFEDFYTDPWKAIYNGAFVREANDFVHDSNDSEHFGYIKRIIITRQLGT